jgi:hypothetical protein
VSVAVAGTQSARLARIRAALEGRIVVLALESVWALTHSEPSIGVAAGFVQPAGETIQMNRSVTLVNTGVWGRT